MALPHITNSYAGVNKLEPLYKNLFEVYFSIPQALKDQGFADEMLLSEQVLSVSGLETLDKSPAVVEQQFKGTTRSYMASRLDNTSHELTITLALNLKDAGKDNFIYKLFKAWNALNYDIATGSKALKTTYTADYFQVAIHNRVGDIYRQITYKDVMLMSVSGFSDLSYDSDDLVQLEIHLKSDYADEENL